MNRFFPLDLVKTVAVFLMLFTHTALIFYDFQETEFNWLSDQGGNLCFSLFLFAMGGTLPILFEKYNQTAFSRRMWVRGLKFYALFVILAVLQMGTGSIVDILILRQVPELTDFVLGFGMFFVVAAVLQQVLRKWNDTQLVVLAALGVALALVLYPLPMPEFILPYKAILVGHADWHRFPVFSYLSILIAGLLISRRFLYWSSRRLLAGTAFVAASALVLNSINGFWRWPPSVGFLLTGLAVAMGVMSLAKNFRWPANAQRFCSELVRPASGITVVHLAILFLIQPQITFQLSGILTLVCSWAILLVSWWLGKFIKL